MYDILLKLELFLLLILALIVIGTAAATYLAFCFFGWPGVPVPALLVALAFWARARYLR